ncbi:MAG: Rrf2 family transcriptional regulator [Pirellulaceae bacterium]|jgi:Rrf2 family protein|nr:Rrf2 family transcriptional regulator [Pirellulaceae bacterium]MDP7020066.1 Rrf2 family transcriptional regulator [Pirellulaceae bacterium]
MKLSRTVGYAVRATLQLARTGSSNPVPCSQLAAEGDMPERFLLQILRNLVTHGILRSSRGVDGGYTLARSPENISLLEIIEAIEGPMAETPAMNPGNPTEARLHDAILQVTETSRRQLEAIKFSQLLSVPDPPIDDAAGGDSSDDGGATDS